MTSPIDKEITSCWDMWPCSKKYRETKRQAHWESLHMIHIRTQSQMEEEKKRQDEIARIEKSSALVREKHEKIKLKIRPGVDLSKDPRT